MSPCAWFICHKWWELIGLFELQSWKEVVGRCRSWAQLMETAAAKGKWCTTTLPTWTAWTRPTTATSRKMKPRKTTPSLRPCSFAIPSSALELSPPSPNSERTDNSATCFFRFGSYSTCYSHAHSHPSIKQTNSLIDNQSLAELISCICDHRSNLSIVYVMTVTDSFFFWLWNTYLGLQ